MSTNNFPQKPENFMRYIDGVEQLSDVISSVYAMTQNDFIIHSEYLTEHQILAVNGLMSTWLIFCSDETKKLDQSVYVRAIHYFLKNHRYFPELQDHFFDKLAALFDTLYRYQKQRFMEQLIAESKASGALQ